MEIKTEEELIKLKEKVAQEFKLKMEIIFEQLDDIYKRNKDVNYIEDLAFKDFN